jgi:hypothetical protein
MAIALEHDVGVATQSEVADWLQELAGGRLSERRRLLQELLEHPARRTLTAADRLEPTREQVWGEPTSVGLSGVSELSPRDDWPARRLTLGLTLALLTLLATAAWYGRTRAPQVARRALPQPAAAEALPVTSAAAAVDPAREELPSGEASPDEGAQPKPVAAPRPALKAHVKPSERARGRGALPPSAAPPKPDCKPYYYVDHQGIRRPKPECL